MFNKETIEERRNNMVSTLYRGSVKNLLGPVSFSGRPAIVFQYTDTYSVFDWGKMPDTIPDKGKALCMMGAYFFEKMKKPESWVEFSKTKVALELRKGIVKLSTDKIGTSGGTYGGAEANISSLGSLFNEVGEELKNQGLKNHYCGLLTEFNSQKINGSESAEVIYLDTLKTPVEYMLVESFPAIYPEFQSVLGRLVPDYSKSTKFSGSKLIPLEFIFRYSCPEGSSLKERIKNNPEILGSIPFPLTEDKQLDVNAREWGFPVMECFSKLEPKDRFMGFSEALSHSGLSANQFQEIFIKTAWVSGFIRHEWDKVGIECVDGKLEWGVNEKGELFLVDHISIDELRLLKDGVQLSKEFLRGYYKKSMWYESVKKAQKFSLERGLTDWKSKVKETPPHLPAEWKKCAQNLYLTLAFLLTGKLEDRATPLNDLISQIKDLHIHGEI